MDSPARKRLQKEFNILEIGQKFQMVNSVMKAAIPGSHIYTKTTDDSAEHNGYSYRIRPEWLCEEVL